MLYIIKSINNINIISLGFTIYDYSLRKLSHLKTELTNQIQNSIQAATNQAKTEMAAEMIKF